MNGDYDKRIYRALQVSVAANIVVGIGLLAWGVLFYQGSTRAVSALEDSSLSARETNAAVVRLTDRMNNIVESAIELRDRVVELEARLDHYETHFHGGADNAGTRTDTEHN